MHGLFIGINWIRKIYFNHSGKLVRCKNGELKEDWLCSHCDSDHEVVVDDYTVVPD